MELEGSENTLLSMFDLLTADVLHGYVRHDNFRILFPMPYISNMTSLISQLSIEYQERLQDVGEVLKRRVKELDKTIESLTQNYSEGDSEIFLLFTEALLLEIEQPGFLAYVKKKMNNTSKRG